MQEGFATKVLARCREQARALGNIIICALILANGETISGILIVIYSNAHGLCMQSVRFAFSVERQALSRSIESCE